MDVGDIMEEANAQRDREHIYAEEEANDNAHAHASGIQETYKPITSPREQKPSTPSTPLCQTSITCYLQR